MKKIIRQLKILEILRVGREPITGEELLEELNELLEEKNISKRTLERYLKTLKDEYEFPIVNERDGEGYYMSDEYTSFNIDLVNYMQSIYFLKLFKEQSEFDKILFPDLKTTRVKGNEYLSVALRAIREQVEVEIEYKKHNDNRRNLRKLRPYALKQVQGIWYLLADEDKKGIRSFGLDRIKSFKPTSKRFVKDESFDIEEKYKYSYGIYSDEKYPIEEVVFVVDWEDGSYLESNKLHVNQWIEKDDDKKQMKVHCKIRITEDFVMALMSRAWSIKILKPLHLKERLHKTFKEAAKRNSKEDDN